MVPTSTQKRAIGNVVNTNITKIFLNGGWQTAGLIADACYEQASETGTLIGTVFVAREIFEIVDALGEDGLLRFYGWSYGTALGSYAAAIFLDRIGAMVLDAKINPHDYQAGHYLNWVESTDEAFEGFLQTCFNVTDDCALYSLLKPKTPQDILDAINLALTPFAQNATTSAEAYTTYANLKGSLIRPLYFPTQWPKFAETLASILNGTTPPPEPPRHIYGAAVNAVLGIRSGDAIFQANSTNEYLPIVRAAASVSPGFNDIAYSNLWPSARWRLPAKERYWGNFRVNTSAPILYVNGEFDPATPLADAYNGSATFAGSVMLPHSGYGHGVFVSPSQCVANYVRAYFSNGTLPKSGARCEPDLNPVQLWRSELKGGGGNSTSNPNGTTGNGTLGYTSDGASCGNNGITLLYAVVLAVVAISMA